jgi:hypothetical protein
MFKTVSLTSPLNSIFSFPFLNVVTCDLPDDQLELPLKQLKLFKNNQIPNQEGVEEYKKGVLVLLAAFC